MATAKTASASSAKSADEAVSAQDIEESIARIRGDIAELAGALKSYGAGKSSVIYFSVGGDYGFGVYYSIECIPDEYREEVERMDRGVITNKQSVITNESSLMTGRWSG